MTMDSSPLVSQFLKHRDLILAYLVALTRDHETAEELFQEVGLAIVDEAQRGTQVDNFPAWAREIARRRVAGYYRERAKDKEGQWIGESLADLVDQAFEENHHFADESPQRFRFLRECLNLLAGRSRDVIEQKYGQGRTIAAIAAGMSWKSESVKVALCRARKTLRDCIERKLRQSQTANDR
jgi:RNA polymerase sigma-70 factor (ECF subfamily)